LGYTFGNVHINVFSQDSPLSSMLVNAKVSWADTLSHSDDILGARMLWKPKEARILKNFIDQPV
jgi:hypothetical protein